MTKFKKGAIVEGIVSGIEDYGIFVKLDQYYNGLIHISEISDGYVRNIEYYAKVGDRIYVEILSVDDQSYHAKLSIKHISYKTGLRSQKRKIVETRSGFNTLEKCLPHWIDKNLKNHKKHSNSIDK